MSLQWVFIMKRLCIHATVASLWWSSLKAAVTKRSSASLLWMQRQSFCNFDSHRICKYFLFSAFLCVFLTNNGWSSFFTRLKASICHRQRILEFTNEREKRSGHSVCTWSFRTQTQSQLPCLTALSFTRLASIKRHVFSRQRPTNNGSLQFMLKCNKHIEKHVMLLFLRH